MPTKTTNFNLIKPGQDDFYNVNDQNANMDTIDGVLKTLQDAINSGATEQELVQIRQDLAAHLADEEKHFKVGEREKWNKGISSETILATADWDNYKTTGFYMGKSLVNAPPFKTGDNEWWFVQVIQHDESWCIQLAWNFNDSKRAMTRSFVKGTWTKWENADGGSATTKEFVVASGQTIKKGDVVKLNSRGEIYKEDKVKYKLEAGGKTVMVAQNNAPYSFTTPNIVTSKYGLAIMQTRHGSTAVETDPNPMRAIFKAVSFDGSEYKIGDVKTEKEQSVTVLNITNYGTLVHCIYDKETFVTAVIKSAKVEIGVFYVNRDTLEITKVLTQTLGIPDVQVAFDMFLLTEGQLVITYVSSSVRYIHALNYDKQTNKLVLGSSQTLTGSSITSGSLRLTPVSNDVFVLSWSSTTSCYAMVLRLNYDTKTFITGTVKAYSTLSNNSSSMAINGIYVGNGKLLMQEGYAGLDFGGYTIDESNLTINKVSSSTIRLASSYVVYDTLTVSDEILIAIRKESNEKDYSTTHKLIEFKTNQPTITEIESLDLPSMASISKIAQTLENNTAVMYIDTGVNGLHGVFTHLTTDKDVIGIATEDATNQKCNVALFGIYDGLSGLEKGAYYASLKGKLVKTSRFNDDRIGKALSPTELQIERR